MALLKENIVICCDCKIILVICRCFKYLLGEAILTTTHVVNRILTSHNSGLSPFEKLYGHAPDYSALSVFGCTYFVLKPHVERTKLSAKSTLCVFMGYGLGKKG